jgi:hypothetical protein
LVQTFLRVIRVCEAISETTGRDQTLLDQEIVVAKLNRTTNLSGSIPTAFI